MRRLALAVIAAGATTASAGGSSTAAGSSHVSDALPGGLDALQPWPGSLTSSAEMSMTPAGTRYQR